MFVVPPLSTQVDRLVDLGVPEMAGIAEQGLRAAVTGIRAGSGDTLLVIAPDRAPATRLAPLMTLGDKHGFIVQDMVDADEFHPIDGTAPPSGTVYVLRGLDRGDRLANLSPDEALPKIHAAGRTPLSLTEGIHWVLQQPEILQRNHCFMTIGSRLRKPDGRLDARTPALWISNGTGRDGRQNRDAPKVGWCWAGNRHTWLGFASAATREPLSI